MSAILLRSLQQKQRDPAKKVTIRPILTNDSTMSEFGLRFHHLGLAVQNPVAARRFAEGQGYRLGAAVFDPQQNVNLILCEHDTEPPIEIIYPAGKEGPVQRLLARHDSGIVYHVGYTSADVERTLSRLEDAQLRPFCVSPPKPAVLFGGALVSFYNVVGMGLIEIIEEYQAPSVS